MTLVRRNTWMSCSNSKCFSQKIRSNQTFDICCGCCCCFLLLLFSFCKLPLLTPISLSPLFDSATSVWLWQQIQSSPLFSYCCQSSTINFASLSTTYHFCCGKLVIHTHTYILSSHIIYICVYIKCDLKSSYTYFTYSFIFPLSYI